MSDLVALPLRCLVLGSSGFIGSHLVQGLASAGHQVMARPGAVLWITPESQFQDVRKRPIVFRPGLGGGLGRAAAVGAEQQQGGERFGRGSRCISGDDEQ